MQHVERIIFRNNLCQKMNAFYENKVIAKYLLVL